MLNVIGHINPDTDSTFSPIVYAWYLNQKGIEAQALLSGEPNKEAQFVLERFEFEKPEIISEFKEGDKLVVIDTNNPDELLPGHEKAEIVEIIDHHKLAGLTTETPLAIFMKPLACSATVIWEYMESEGFEMKDIPGNIASAMLACILSDTLNLTSPTTTDRDREVVGELEEITGLSRNDLSQEMFEAKSDLSGMDIKDILLSDSKVFDFMGDKVRVSVLETTSPQKALEKEQDIIRGVQELKAEQELDAMFFFVVDIMENNSTLIACDEVERSLAKKAFGKEINGCNMMLEGVVSRKKQMVPTLEEAIKTA